MGSTYAPIRVDGNGKSFPQVEMTMTAMVYQKGKAQSKRVLGTWKAGLPGNITFAAGQSLRPFKVIGVYKVAVVVVSIVEFQ